MCEVENQRGGGGGGEEGEAISRLVLIMLLSPFPFTEALLPAPHLDALSCQNYFISISAFTTSEGGMQGNDVQGTD